MPAPFAWKIDHECPCAQSGVLNGECVPRNASSCLSHSGSVLWGAYPPDPLGPPSFGILALSRLPLPGHPWRARGWWLAVRGSQSFCWPCVDPARSAFTWPYAESVASSAASCGGSGGLRAAGQEKLLAAKSLSSPPFQKPPHLCLKEVKPRNSNWDPARIRNRR